MQEAEGLAQLQVTRSRHLPWLRRRPRHIANNISFRWIFTKIQCWNESVGFLFHRAAVPCKLFQKRHKQFYLKQSQQQTLSVRASLDEAAAGNDPRKHFFFFSLRKFVNISSCRTKAYWLAFSFSLFFLPSFPDWANWVASKLSI